MALVLRARADIVLTLTQKDARKLRVRLPQVLCQQVTFLLPLELLQVESWQALSLQMTIIITPAHHRPATQDLQAWNRLL